MNKVLVSFLANVRRMHQMMFGHLWMTKINLHNNPTYKPEAAHHCAASAVFEEL